MEQRAPGGAERRRAGAKFPTSHNADSSLGPALRQRWDRVPRPSALQTTLQFAQLEQRFDRRQLVQLEACELAFHRAGSRRKQAEWLHATGRFGAGARDLGTEVFGVLLDVEEELLRAREPVLGRAGARPPKVLVPRPTPSSTTRERSLGASASAQGWTSITGWRPVDVASREYEIDPLAADLFARGQCAREASASAVGSYAAIVQLPSR